MNPTLGSMPDATAPPSGAADAETEPAPDHVTSEDSSRVVAADGTSGAGQSPPDAPPQTPQPPPTIENPAIGSSTSDVPPPVQGSSQASGSMPPAPPPLPASIPRPRSPATASAAPDAGNLHPSRKAQRYRDMSMMANDASVCPRCKGGGRNLVVCIDGTSNQFSKKNTNVVELYSRLVKSNDEQLTFYNSGIGTYAQPSWISFSYYKQVISNKLDLAFALRFNKIILSAYEWLADNYVEGDRIFLFGRRVPEGNVVPFRPSQAFLEVPIRLNALQMGLIHKGNADQIPFAYELYSNVDFEDQSPSARVSGVLKHNSLRTLSLLIFLRCLWAAWYAGGQSTILKQISIWIVATLTLTHCIFSSWSSEPATLNVHGANVPADNADRESVSDAGSVVDDVYDGPITEKQQALRGMQERFKKTFARNVRVHFVGAWDTVSSVGLIRDKTLPGTTEGMKHVCYFRHALALHERRVKFLPEFVNGGLGPSNVPGSYGNLDEVPDTMALDTTEDGNGRWTRRAFLAVVTWLSAAGNAVLAYAPHAPAAPTQCPPSESQSGDGPSRKMTSSDAERDPPHTKEVWFHGSHSDIGGGASPNEKLRSFGPTLRWMSFEARLAGLKMSKEPRRWDTRLFKTQSLSPFWTLIEFLPVKRLTYNSTSDTTYRPHLSSQRRFQPGQLVYGGVSEKAKKRLCGAGLKIENDPYLGAEDFLKRLQQYVTEGTILREEDRIRIEALSNSVLGQQQLHDMKEDISGPLISMLNLCNDDPKDQRLSLVSTIQRLLYGFEYSFDAMVNSRYLCDVLGVSPERGAFPGPIRHHSHPIRSVVCLPDGKGIISSDWDEWIFQWDLSSGRRTDCITKDSDVWAVSQDGRYGVARSLRYGTAVRVLDESAKVHAKLSDPSSYPYCTVFSHDNSRVACGSVDGITLWDIREGGDGDATATVRTTTFSGGRYVMALAFSPNSNSLICGGADYLIERWSLGDTAVSRGYYVGHTGGIHSVAFSPDGSRIASGSNDQTVRIWSMLHHSTLHVIAGHTSLVQAVAFSPCGRHIVSGSHDHSVRMWDALTGQPIGVPLNGHTSPVYCVTFSKGGAQVVAGAKDGTIRIWDRMPHVPFASQVTHHAPVQPLAVPALIPVPEPVALPDTAAVEPPAVSLDTNVTGVMPDQPTQPGSANLLSIEAVGGPSADPEHDGAAVAPRAEGYEGKVDAEVTPRADRGHAARTETDHEEPAEESSQTAEKGPDAEADAQAASPARGLESTPDQHGVDDGNSPTQSEPRDDSGGADSTETAPTARLEDVDYASAATPSAVPAELIAGPSKTTPGPGPHAAGSSQDAAAPGVEAGADAQAAACGISTEARSFDASASSEGYETRGAVESPSPGSTPSGEREPAVELSPTSPTAESEGSAPESHADAVETVPEAEAVRRGHSVF